jgi:hypothetical protein
VGLETPTVQWFAQVRELFETFGNCLVDVKGGVACGGKFSVAIA